MATVTLNRHELGLLKESGWTDEEIKKLKKQYGDYININLVPMDAEYKRREKK